MSASRLDPVAASPSAASAGARTEIGGCTLDRVLGSGGMGVVWAGTRKRDGRSVAIKLLRSSGDEAARAELRARLDRARAIDDDHVARVLDVGTEDGRDFVVMERIGGKSLADWLALGPAPGEIAAAVLAAGRGLAAGHRAGVVHRNFTLHSAIRNDEGRVAVTDFGAALGQLDPKAEHTLAAVALASGHLGGDGKLPRQQDALLDAALSQAGVFIGTPGYMAPELLRGEPASEKSDQFAFCVATWEAWSGHRPFHGESLADLVKVASATSPPAPPGMPPALHRALVRGLSADPALRWPDMASLLDELTRATAARGHGMVLAIGAVVALACLVTLVTLLRC